MSYKHHHREGLEHETTQSCGPVLGSGKYESINLNRLVDLVNTLFQTQMTEYWEEYKYMEGGWPRISKRHRFSLQYKGQTFKGSYSFSGLLSFLEEQGLEPTLFQEVAEYTGNLLEVDLRGQGNFYFEGLEIPDNLVFLDRSNRTVYWADGEEIFTIEEERWDEESNDFYSRQGLVRDYYFPEDDQYL